MLLLFLILNENDLKFQMLSGQFPSGFHPMFICIFISIQLEFFEHEWKKAHIQISKENKRMERNNMLLLIQNVRIVYIHFQKFAMK